VTLRVRSWMAVGWPDGCSAGGPAGWQWQDRGGRTAGV